MSFLTALSPGCRYFAASRVFCFVAVFAGVSSIYAASGAKAAGEPGVGKRAEKALRATDVFDYSTPVLFRDDFTQRDFGRWNISQNDQYRLTEADSRLIRVVDGEGGHGPRAAARFEVTRAPNSFRSEISLPHENGYQERWYGLRVKLAADWVPDDSNGDDIVIQWHGLPGNWRATHPNLALSVQGDRWRIRQNFGSAQSNPTRTSVLVDGLVQPGAWTSWVIHARWSAGEDGVVRIWKDGVIVLEHRGINIYNTIGIEYTPYMKTGIYHPEWHLDDDARRARYEKAKPVATTRVVYVADVVVGDARANFGMVAPR